MKRRIAILAVLAAMAPAAFAQARAVSVSGTVSIKRAGRDLGALRAQFPVRPGDEIATGENSEAVIQSAGGATVRVYPDSRVVFQESTPDIREWLHLVLGSIKVHIEKISGRPNPHTMTTPTAIIGVRGTTFNVFVDEVDATMVQVDEGLVSVASRAAPQDEMLLRPGQRAWVRRGAPPMQARDTGPGNGRDKAANSNKSAAAEKPGNGPKPGRGSQMSEIRSAAQSRMKTPHTGPAR